MSSITINDTFTDTNGTTLASHTPDTGGVWTKVSGNALSISSNATTSSSGGVTIYTQETVPTADVYKLRAKVKGGSATGSSFFTQRGFNFCHNGTTTYYKVTWQSAGYESNNVIRIDFDRVNAGTIDYTKRKCCSIAGYGYTTQGSIEVEVRHLSGKNVILIYASLDNSTPTTRTLLLYAEDTTTPLASGAVGLYNYEIGSSSYDDFQMEEFDTDVLGGEIDVPAQASQTADVTVAEVTAASGGTEPYTYTWWYRVPRQGAVTYTSADVIQNSGLQQPGAWTQISGATIATLSWSGYETNKRYELVRLTADAASGVSYSNIVRVLTMPRLNGYLLLMVGDSRTDGDYSNSTAVGNNGDSIQFEIPDAATDHSVVQKAAARFALWQVRKVAENGWYISDLSTNLITNSYVANLLSGLALNSLVIWVNIGTNDAIYNEVTDAAATSAAECAAGIVSRTLTLVTNIRAAVPAALRLKTYVVVECLAALETVTSASATHTPGDIAQLVNTSLKASAYKYNFVTYPTTLTAPSNNLDTTYFRSDAIHFTNAGKNYRTAQMGYILSVCAGDTVVKNNMSGMTWNMAQQALKSGKRPPVGMNRFASGTRKASRTGNTIRRR